jgi:replicative DNA helicase
MQRATSGTLDRDTDFKKLWAAKKVLTSVGEIYIDESMEANPNEIVAKCRRLKKDKGLDLVMIDYLQLMLGATTNGRSAESRQQEIGSITRTLKMMAMELKVPVLLLSQVNRAGAKRNSDEGGLQLFDLRDSGSIEQDADIVIFLSPQDRNETSSDKLVTLKIAKHRNGPQGEIPLKFSGETVSFRELTRAEIREEEVKKSAPKNSENTTNEPLQEEYVPPMDDSLAPPQDDNVPPIDDGNIQY